MHAPSQKWTSPLSHWQRPEVKEWRYWKIKEQYDDKKAKQQRHLRVHLVIDNEVLASRPISITHCFRSCNDVLPHWFRRSNQWLTFTWSQLLVECFRNHTATCIKFMSCNQHGNQSYRTYNYHKHNYGCVNTLKILILHKYNLVLVECNVWWNVPAVL